jgi:hypothetical protein
MKFSFVYGLVLGIIFWVLVAGCLYLWSFTLPTDVQLVSRFTCAIGIVFCLIAIYFGNLAGFAVEFFRAPFLLQPISIFGFATLGMLPIFNNGAIAWYTWGVLKTKSPFPVKLTRWFSNPVLFRVVFWVLWIVMGGIITAAHKPIGSVKVATVGVIDRARGLIDAAQQYGALVREQVDKTGA